MTDDAFPAEPGFEVLADPKRLDILRTLTEQLRDDPEDPTIGFSDLRREVGVRDSGNFNYHLDRLRGRFVRKTDGGYRITAAGMKVVGAALAGVYAGGDELDSTSIDHDCPVCDRGLTATYEDGLLTVACPNDHQFRNPLPPGSVDERGLEALVELATMRTHQNLEMAVEGTCPLCNARLEWSAGPPFDSEFAHFVNQCSRCGAMIEVPVVAALLTHPTVIGFYDDHGIDARRRPLWAPEFYNGVAVGVRTDPVRIDVSVELEGDGLTATLDETLSVLAVET